MAKGQKKSNREAKKPKQRRQNRQPVQNLYSATNPNHNIFGQSGKTVAAKAARKMCVVLHNTILARETLRRSPVASL